MAFPNCEWAEPEQQKVKDLNLACKLCLEDVLEWLKTGRINEEPVALEAVIGVVELTLAGRYPPERFQIGDVDEHNDA